MINALKTILNVFFGVIWFVFLFGVCINSLFNPSLSNFLSLLFWVGGTIIYFIYKWKTKK